MLAAMPVKLWLEWQAYYGLDPWDEERADLRMGIICSVLDACHRVKGQPSPPSAFMPGKKHQQPQQSLAEQKAIFKMAKAAFAKGK